MTTKLQELGRFITVDESKEHGVELVKIHVDHKKPPRELADYFIDRVTAIANTLYDPRIIVEDNEIYIIGSTFRDEGFDNASL